MTRPLPRHNATFQHALAEGTLRHHQAPEQQRVGKDTKLADTSCVGTKQAPSGVDPGLRVGTRLVPNGGVDSLDRRFPARKLHRRSVQSGVSLTSPSVFSAER